MWGYLWPLLLIVGANVCYNLSTKLTPSAVSPFASLSVTYLVAALLSVVLYFVFGGREFLTDLKAVNWTAFVLSFSVVSLEAGFMFLYRAGWDISIGQFTASALLTVCLVIIGIAFFKETVTVKQFLGIALCLGGLVLINLK